MKKLFTLTIALCGIAVLIYMAACASTSTVTSASSQKESLVQQAGFKPITVTTPTQQQRVSQLPQGKVSAVTYKGKLYYVYPTAQKDRIYCGRQAQFNTYKQLLQAQQPTVAQQAQSSQTNQNQPVPYAVEETAGPRHILVEEFDGFGPVSDPMD